MPHEDILTEAFFAKHRWEKGIQKAVDKEIKPSLLKKLCLADTRVKLYRQIRDGKYRVTPPHEARIPKENGEFRTVYVNEAQDRVILNILNDLFFEFCPENIHPNCYSYQTGIGCGKVVKKVSKIVQNMNSEEIGVKIDLSKYFDSVAIEDIDDAFDTIERKLGPSAMLDLIRDYYHDNRVLDIDKNEIEKYSSLRQGCPVAAYLADAVLKPIDDKLSRMDIAYFRYSDDILLIGENWREGFEILKAMLADMQLTLNPKKVEPLYKHRWFKFLGFNIKNDLITLSKTRIKTFQSEITARCYGRNNLPGIIRAVNRYLYFGDGEYSWASSVMPVINCQPDIMTLNAFVMDAIRAGATGNKRIGGLGCNMTGETSCVVRGTGRHVTTNRKTIPQIEDYLTLDGYRKAANISAEAASALVSSLI